MGTRKARAFVSVSEGGRGFGSVFHHQVSKRKFAIQKIVDFFFSCRLQAICRHFWFVLAQRGVPFEATKRVDGMPRGFAWPRTQRTKRSATAGGWRLPVPMVRWCMSVSQGVAQVMIGEEIQSPYNKAKCKDLP